MRARDHHKFKKESERINRRYAKKPRPELSKLAAMYEAKMGEDRKTDGEILEASGSLGELENKLKSL